MSSIAHVINASWDRNVVDGGSNRENALAGFLESRGAVDVVVQDPAVWDSGLGRLVRPLALVREVRALKPEMVALHYPAYPFFWRHKVTRYTLGSVLFASLLRRASKRDGFKIAVDVLDLPAYQYEDLGFRLEMRPGTLRRFDRFVFSRADYLWVCSESISRLLRDDYAVPEEKLIIALNGYHALFARSTNAAHRVIPNECEESAFHASKKADFSQARNDVNDAGDPSTLRFIYAGSMNPERGIEHVMEEFLSRDLPGCELHLCGCYGEWIAEKYADPRLICHGSLSDAEAARVASSCHVGLIPYPERGYYHLAFATKLAFYMGLGLPVICSNVRETGSHVDRLGIGLRWPIDDFGAAFEHVALNREELNTWQKRVMEVREDFRWSSIYSKALDETLRRAAR